MKQVEVTLRDNVLLTAQHVLETPYDCTHTEWYALVRRAVQREKWYCADVTDDLIRQCVDQLIT